MHYILAVSEDPEDIPVLCQALENEFERFEIRVADNVNVALKQVFGCAVDNFPSLIVLEASSRSPVLDFITQIRKKTIYRRIPVVVISEFLTSLQIKELYSEGVNCFIPKPHTPSEWSQMAECMSLLFLKNFGAI